VHGQRLKQYCPRLQDPCGMRLSVQYVTLGTTKDQGVAEGDKQGCGEADGSTLNI